VVPHQDSPAFEGSSALDEEDVPEAERGLTDKEQSEVEKAQRPRAPVVYEIIRLEGERELRRPAASLWWSGVAAGISIGFSFLSEAALGAELPSTPWTHIIASAGYTAGFIIVILGRQQLFTENVLTAVLPVLLMCMPIPQGGVCCHPRTGFPFAFAIPDVLSRELKKKASFEKRVGGGVAR